MRSDSKNRVDVEMDLIIRNRASKIISLGTIGVSLKIAKTRFFSKTNEKRFLMSICFSKYEVRCKKTGLT
jgi:hypothetical protein